MPIAKNLLALNAFSIKIIKIIFALITLLDKSIICCRFWLFAIRKSDLHAQMNIKLLESIELRYYTHTHTHIYIYIRCLQWLWILCYAKSIIT